MSTFRFSSSYDAQNLPRKSTLTFFKDAARAALSLVNEGFYQMVRLVFNTSYGLAKLSLRIGGLMVLGALPLKNLLAQEFTALSSANLDPRGDAEIVVCSQNLANFGNRDSMKLRFKNLTKELRNRKLSGLVKRFDQAKCDIVAVQEVLGRDRGMAEEALSELATAFGKRTGKRINTLLGDGQDKFLRVGYLYNRDKAKLIAVTSYKRVELPRLLASQRPRFFRRAPLEAQFLVKGAGKEGTSRLVTLINIHFKSKFGGRKDPAQLDWETERMEMSEAVRRIVISRHREAILKGKTVLMVLGDRNSHFDSASAKILEGRLRLQDFDREGDCRLGKAAIPLCKGGVAAEQTLFSVLTTDPQVGLLEGSFKYRDEMSWLDDIAMPASALKYAIKSPAHPGDFDSGVVGEYHEASDHRLVWVGLNW